MRRQQNRVALYTGAAVIQRYRVVRPVPFAGEPQHLSPVRPRGSGTVIRIRQHCRGRLGTCNVGPFGEFVARKEKYGLEDH